VRRKDLWWAIERGAALEVVRVSADAMSRGSFLGGALATVSQFESQFLDGSSLFRDELLEALPLLVRLLKGLAKLQNMSLEFA
jgi:hypothetical protein